MGSGALTGREHGDSGIVSAARRQLGESPAHGAEKTGYPMDVGIAEQARQDAGHHHTVLEGIPCARGSLYAVAEHPKAPVRAPHQVRCVERQRMGCP